MDAPQVTALVGDQWLTEYKQNFCNYKPERDAFWRVQIEYYKQAKD